MSSARKKFHKASFIVHDSWDAEDDDPEWANAELENDDDLDLSKRYDPVKEIPLTPFLLAQEAALREKPVVFQKKEPPPPPPLPPPPTQAVAIPQASSTVNHSQVPPSPPTQAAPATTSKSASITATFASTKPQDPPPKRRGPVPATVHSLFSRERTPPPKPYGRQWGGAGGGAKSGAAKAGKAGTTGGRKTTQQPLAVATSTTWGPTKTRKAPEPKAKSLLEKLDAVDSDEEGGGKAKSKGMGKGKAKATAPKKGARSKKPREEDEDGEDEVEESAKPPAKKAKARAPAKKKTTTTAAKGKGKKKVEEDGIKFGLIRESSLPLVLVHANECSPRDRLDGRFTTLPRLQKGRGEKQRCNDSGR